MSKGLHCNIQIALICDNHTLPDITLEVLTLMKQTKMSVNFRVYHIVEIKHHKILLLCYIFLFVLTWSEVTGVEI